MNYILRCIRFLNDETLAVASVKLGISKPYLCQVEHSKKKPSLRLIEKYGEVYGLPVHRLFKVKEETRKAPKQVIKREIRKRMICLMSEILNKPTDNNSSDQ